MKNCESSRELEFPILFNKLTKNFNKKLGDFLVPYGLSKLHSFYMVCLYMHKKGLTLNQLNFMTGCDKANTSRAISDMEDKGIVVRSSGDNEKKYKVMLTDKGINIGKDFVKSVKESIKRAFSSLTDKEVSVFHNVIFKLVKEVACDTN